MPLEQPTLTICAFFLCTCVVILLRYYGCGGYSQGIGGYYPQQPIYGGQAWTGGPQTWQPWDMSSQRTWTKKSLEAYIKQLQKSLSSFDKTSDSDEESTTTK